MMLTDAYLSGEHKSISLEEAVEAANNRTLLAQAVQGGRRKLCVATTIRRPGGGHRRAYPRSPTRAFCAGIGPPANLVSLTYTGTNPVNMSIHQLSPAVSGP